MPNSAPQTGESLEVLGSCMTNPKPGSNYSAKVEYRHLWSYAQQAALIAVSEKDPKTQRYHLIKDPERRAKRIAAHYADLYFRSSKRSNKRIQLLWAALAAFVVKDIVEAFRYAREEVLQHRWNGVAAIGRNSAIGELLSMALTDDSPYQHALRLYAALAKGNLWLFMDIYPWLWFFLEFGINPDGSLNRQRLSGCLAERNWDSFLQDSKTAVEELPYGPNWLKRLAARLKADPIYQKGTDFFKTSVIWHPESGYGAHQASAYAAHHYCKANVQNYDAGYRMPASPYWKKFPEAFYVMESEHTELSWIVKDGAALKALVKIREFRMTTAIQKTYSTLIDEFNARAKAGLQKDEVIAIAEQEQLNVLQPLIYNDARLKETMDLNHQFSRATAGWASPKMKVIYSASPANRNAEYETVFDAPANIRDQFSRINKSLTNPVDRMKFVAAIAKDFNRLMQEKRPYMDGELKKIHAWMCA